MRFIFSLLSLSLVLSAKSLDIDLTARSAILMNGHTGAILYEKNAHARSYPASTTKVATALYILEQGTDLQRTTTVSAESLRGRPLKDRDHLPAYWLDSDGTMMGLKRGETLSFEALLHGLMLISGNDAANVLAESIGGSVPGFMKLMNEYLPTLGCKNTQFTNPHGLHHPDHYSTAYDLALVAKRALELPSFRKLSSTITYTKPKTNKQPPGEIKTFNALIKPTSRYYYSKAIGIKTGFTNAAQNTLVSAAEHEGRLLIAVLLGCEKSATRFEEAKKLFETAFRETKEKRRLIGPENVFSKEILGSKSPLKAAIAKPLSFEYYPSEEPRCKAALHWSCESLPIRKGDKVGEVHILSEEGQFIQKGDLIAIENVKGTLYFTLKEKLNQFFRRI